MKKGYMYILLCSDGSYYTGSTVDLDLRLLQHQKGKTQIIPQSGYL
jgi:putative endonuclease